MIQLFRSWTQRYFSDPQILILGFLLFLGFLLVFWLGDVLTPVFASIVIAYLLEGIVTWLQKMRMPRMASVIAVFLLFVASLFVLIIGLLPMLSSQIMQLIGDIPSMLASGQKQLILFHGRFPEFITEKHINEITTFLNPELPELPELLKFTKKFAKNIVTLSLASVRGFISIVVYLILVPLMVFFFLKDKTKITLWVKGFLPEERRLASEVWHEVNGQVANYVRGKIWEILIIWAVSYITFKLLGLRFTALISLVIGLSVIVPYIGATVVTLPVAVIAWFQWGWSSEFTYVLIAYGIIQTLDGNLLVPLLLSEVVDLHPVAIIVAVLVFGKLWGIWGLFFAIPLATLVHSVIKAWFKKHPKEKEDEKECQADLKLET
ncbi:MAG: AI-2E family transporter [Desulfobacteraceae bacterium]|nr:AI-2E family transporter [Desulfobacteraceae bacterium]